MLKESIANDWLNPQANSSGNVVNATQRYELLRPILKQEKTPKQVSESTDIPLSTCVSWSSWNWVHKTAGAFRSLPVPVALCESPTTKPEAQSWWCRTTLDGWSGLDPRFSKIGIHNFLQEVAEQCKYNMIIEHLSRVERATSALCFGYSSRPRLPKWTHKI